MRACVLRGARSIGDERGLYRTVRGLPERTRVDEAGARCDLHESLQQGTGRFRAARRQRERDRILSTDRGRNPDAREPPAARARARAEEARQSGSPELPAAEREEEEWGIRGALEGILKDFAKYRRQYVGIVAQGGARRVLVNCFPEVLADGRDDFADWKLRWIDYVDDGAWEFWHIEYDVASGQFLGFGWNPSG